VEWRAVFYLSAAIYFFGALVFCLLAQGEVQPWVRPYMTQDVSGVQEDTDIQSVGTVAVGSEAVDQKKEEVNLTIERKSE